MGWPERMRCFRVGREDEMFLFVSNVSDNVQNLLNFLLQPQHMIS
jgi:hypothetical protein